MRKLTLIILVVIFGVYNLTVYLSQSAYNSENKMTKEHLAGENLWQQKNCTACHQLYGLGGYLGPDLTNVISSPDKGKAYVRTMIQSGIKSMPIFDLSSTEIEQLIAFLEHVDQSGYYPIQQIKFSPYGWVTLPKKPPYENPEK